MKTVDDILNEILRREGWPQYTNLPADRGGPTKGGITLKAWQEHTGNPLATIDDLKVITEAEAIAFYRQRYIIGPRFDGIVDPALRELVVDVGVHHGQRRSAKWLQRAAKVRQDGRVGPVTLGAVNASNPQALYLWIVAYRVRLFGRLVSRDSQLTKASAAGWHLQAIFAAGWNNRAAEFIEALAVKIGAPPAN